MLGLRLATDRSTPLVTDGRSGQNKGKRMVWAFEEKGGFSSQPPHCKKVWIQRLTPRNYYLIIHCLIWLNLFKLNVNATRAPSALSPECGFSKECRLYSYSFVVDFHRAPKSSNWNSPCRYKLFFTLPIVTPSSFLFSGWRLSFFSRLVSAVSF